MPAPNYASSSTSIKEKICPTCGATSKSTQFAGSFCINHLPVKFNPPNKFGIVRCGVCGSTKLLEWGEHTQEQIEQFICSKLKSASKCVSVNFDLASGSATFFLDYNGSLLSFERKVEIGEFGTTCQTCSRKSGGYFQAIIQFRAPTKEKSLRFAKRVEAYLKKNSFVSKLEQLREGYDLYAGERQKAIESLNFFGLPYLRTEKLHGMSKEGKKVYRTTLLVRLD